MIWTESFVEVQDNNMQEEYQIHKQTLNLWGCPIVAAKILFQIEKKRYVWSFNSRCVYNSLIGICPCFSDAILCFFSKRT